MKAMKSEIKGKQPVELKYAGDAMFRAMQWKLGQNQLVALQMEFASLFQRRPYNDPAAFR
jgi:hypothetical protein